MTNKYKDQELKLKQARIALLSVSPFFGDIAYGLPIIFDDTLDPPTAATDGEKVYWHPEFVDKLPPKQLVFVYGHEVMHPALMHIFRRGNRDPRRWNAACDYVVNHLLVESKIGEQPEWTLYDPNIYYKGNGKVEDIYDLLPEDHGDAMDKIIDAAAKDAANMVANWRNKITQAAQTAKAAGNFSGALEQFVNQMTTPKVRWQDKLRALMMTTRGRDKTWARVNRRYRASNIMLPGTDGEQMGELVFAIDCSGSTSDAMVQQCGAEVRSIQEEMRPEKTHVIYFDSDVKKHEEFDADEPMEVKVYGRGGTAFSPVFKYIADNGIDPQTVVVATDLDCYDFGPTPPYPVIWAVMESGLTNAPFGDVIVVT